MKNWDRAGTAPAWRRSAVVASIATLTFVLASNVANAQQASTPPADQSGLEEITVTGVRAAIQSAIAAKQKSDEIVEVISAEDIGKLPDTSIAESISRLPGLTSQRSDGRASDISIRGTDPQFATGLLNGRQQVSTGDNRNIEYDQYPAELISRVVVYKTTQATLIGQGLSGTIALETTRPLEFGHTAFAANVRGEKNSDANLGSDSKNDGYRFSVSYIDQYFDHTLGLTLGYARLDTPIVGKELGSYDPWQPASNFGLVGIPGTVMSTNGIKSLASSGLNQRDGSLATLEWRPIDKFTSTLDAYYTNANYNNDRRSVEVNLGNFNGYPNSTCPICTGTAVYSNETYSNGSLIGATVGNVVPLARNFSYLTRDQIFSTGWNNIWKEDSWSVMTDFAFSRATRDEKDYETQGQYIGGVTDTATYYLPQSSQPTFTLGNSYDDPSKIFVGPTIYGGGYSRFPHVTDKLQSYKIEGSHALGWWFSDAVIGFNYDDRTKDKIQPETGLNTVNGFINVDPSLLLAPANLGFSGTPGALAWNVPGVLSRYFQPIVPTIDAGFLVGKTWEVFEKVSTGYLKGDLNHEFSSDLTLRGNIGLQFIHTNQSSSSYLFNPALTGTPAGDLIPFSLGKSYNDVLPAMNLIFVLPNQQDVRFSLSKQIARARMDQLAASDEFGIDTTRTPAQPGTTKGNPLLDPWRAKAVDLAFDKYFENKAYVSAALFYKKLDTYIYNQTIQNYDFSREVGTLPVGVPTSPAGSTASCPLNQPNGAGVQTVCVGTFGPATIPLNGNGGRLDGVELSASLPGELFTHYLTGFGIQASYSWTDSSITIPGTVSGINESNIPLPGLSKNVWQVTGYYERYGFSARIATRYRGKYIGEITDFAGDRSLEFVRQEQINDAQLSYEFQSGPATGLSILLQVNNFTNTPFIDYSGSPQNVRDYETFGRDFFFGFNYKWQR
jgi:iron complex outermembrane recepter protein